ncbi:metallophosphoesterase [Aquibacillus sediminis]|uniref:metallophosphoesterase n=1 Tax=Aquibacillus sediminis TaxID=2574734 RepID=UPI001108FF3A|nr:metallophosphoesterase [Aquibacillus sediminis]
MKKWLVLCGILVIILVIVAKIYYDTNHFKVNTIEFDSSKLSQGTEVTILQISDVHNKVFDQDNQPLLREVESLNADLIVLTGDLIDRRTEDFQHMYNLIEKLTAINSDIFFVSGNHEWENTETEDFIQGVRERNVTLLNNRSKTIEVDGIEFNMVGIDDASTNHEDPAKAFSTIEQDRYTILLSHDPDIVKNYPDMPANLILSGHTHGGQVRMPFVGAIVAPGQGLFPKLDQGTYPLAENQRLYIDSGLGTSLAPIRFLNQSQISLITIRGE